MPHFPINESELVFLQHLKAELVNARRKGKMPIKKYFLAYISHILVSGLLMNADKIDITDSEIKIQINDPIIKEFANLITFIKNNESLKNVIEELKGKKEKEEKEEVKEEET